MAIEKFDDMPDWLATNDPREINRAVHRLLQSITISTEAIELMFK